MTTWKIIIGAGDEGRLVFHTLSRQAPTHAAIRFVVCGDSPDQWVFDNAQEISRAFYGGANWSTWTDTLVRFIHNEITAYEPVYGRAPQFQFFRAIGRSDHWFRVYSTLWEKLFVNPVCRENRQAMSAGSCVFGDEVPAHYTGSIIHDHVHFGMSVKIGTHCILNTRAIIEHDCVIGDGVFVGPNATLLGNVHVGDYSFIGAGAIVCNGVRIGQHAFVKAGEVVKKDIPDQLPRVGAVT